MQQVTVEELLTATADEAGFSGFLFDLRPASSVAADGLPGAQPLSLEGLQAGDLPDVPKDAALYLLCERGAVSELAGLYLEAGGFGEVYNVLGGVKAYRGLQSADTER